MSLARLAASTPVHVACGFAAMGGWAIWANAGHGMRAALMAGLVQGALSGALTLGLKRSVDWMRPRMAGLAAYLLPPAVAAGCSTMLLVLAHLAAGTPEVAVTVAVPLAVSVTYIFAYNILRQRRTKGVRNA
jgi:mannose/fructose/N-acetylgalactosamine-specific phosphotransferase system component IIC